MSPTIKEPKPGKYIAFLTRLESSEMETLAKGRSRSDFLFDAISLEAASTGNMRNVEAADRPLIRLKTTQKHFQRISGRPVISPGEWFLIEIIRRPNGSWVWAATEDVNSLTGYRSAGNFSARTIEYLDPNRDVGPTLDPTVAKTFSLVQKAFSLTATRSLRHFRRLERALSIAPQLFVEAIDVGQASFICIHDGQTSFFYFDAGLPLWFNAKSLPRNLKFFTPHKHAVIVLSHWDYDHYSAAQKFKDLNALRCIAPADELGPNAGKFAKEMGNRLLRLSYGDKVTVGPIKIRWATGPAGDRNNRGIIGIVELSDQKVLLTGDAAYQFIKPRYRQNLTGVSIPHHASIHLHSATDVPNPISPAIAVISAGKPNKYGHPNITTISDHNTNWQVEVTGAWPSKVRGNKRF